MDGADHAGPQLEQALVVVAGVSTAVWIAVRQSQEQLLNVRSALQCVGDDAVARDAGHALAPLIGHSRHVRVPRVRAGLARLRISDTVTAIPGGEVDSGDTVAGLNVMEQVRT